MRNLKSTTLLFELSQPGRRGATLPECDVPAPAAAELLPADALADAPPPLPEVAEPEVVRHFTNLSTLNMSVDTHFYPLGSCTMKYNSKRNERMAALPGIADLHPLAAGGDDPGAACNCSSSCSRCWPKSRACRPSRCSRRPGRMASWPR